LNKRLRKSLGLRSEVKKQKHIGIDFIFFTIDFCLKIFFHKQITTRKKAQKCF
jgi:hypothetical protein